MAEEALREITDAMRQRIQAELDAQIQALTARHNETIARARQDAEAEVEKRWSLKVDAVRSEWSARLQSEVATARDDAEKRLVSESIRVREEAEQTLSAERQQFERDARGRQSAEVNPTPLLGATRAIGDARSLSDALSSLVRGASAHAPRFALFIVNGTRLDEWAVAGVAPMAHEPISLQQGGLLHAAVSRGTGVSAEPGDPGRRPPPFASLPSGGTAIAMPLMLGGQAVAVLYADDGVSGTGRSNHDWPEAVELLARHTAVCLAHLTAVRLLKVLEGGNEHERVRAATLRPDDERSARRYAKLLVSEIKLYNEGAVRVGCEKRDLLHRLKDEIDLARRLYEERVPSTVAGRSTYFQQELVHTLAGGDAAVLGS